MVLLMFILGLLHETCDVCAFVLGNSMSAQIGGPLPCSSKVEHPRYIEESFQEFIWLLIAWVYALCDCLFQRMGATWIINMISREELHYGLILYPLPLTLNLHFSILTQNQKTICANIWLVFNIRNLSLRLLILYLAPRSWVANLSS